MSAEITLIGIESTSLILGKSIKTVNRYIREGKLTISHTQDRQKFFNKKEVEVLLAEINKTSARFALCCPKEKHYAKDKCYQCYMRELMRKVKKK
jgi:hypothetical protein